MLDFGKYKAYTPVENHFWVLELQISDSLSKKYFVQSGHTSESFATIATTHHLSVFHITIMKVGQNNG